MPSSGQNIVRALRDSITSGARSLWAVTSSGQQGFGVEVVLPRIQLRLRFVLPPRYSHVRHPRFLRRNDTINARVSVGVQCDCVPVPVARPVGPRRTYESV